jgi:rhodanese-related sulfurtransferase
MKLFLSASFVAAIAAADCGLVNNPNLYNAINNYESGAYEAIIDVRGAATYNDGHLPFAANVPGLAAGAAVDIASVVAAVGGNLNTRIGTVCQFGDASRAAAAALRNYGFTCVSALGGTPDWEAAGVSLDFQKGNCPRIKAEPKVDNAIRNYQRGRFDMIVDVRGASSYNGGHVAFAYNSPGLAGTSVESQVAQVTALAGGNMNMPIGTICQTGPAAVAARQNLKDAGFKCVYALGGTPDWEAAGIELDPEGS